MFDFIYSFMDMTGSVAGSITLGITIITSISLLIVNLARFFQATKFGLPLKMINQASLPDSLDLWLICISAFGFGMLLPDFLANSDIFIPLRIVGIFLLCWINLLLLRSKANFKMASAAGSLYISIGTSKHFVAITSLLATCAYIYMGIAHNTWVTDTGFDGHLIFHILFHITNVILYVYAALIILIFLTCLASKLYGDKENMTVEINGHTYLLAVRHNAYSWVLMPCTLGEKEDGKKFITYKKGRFIIRDMSSLDEQYHITSCLEYIIYPESDNDLPAPNNLPAPPENINIESYEANSKKQ